MHLNKVLNTSANNMSWSETTDWTIWLSYLPDKRTSVFRWLLHSLHATKYYR